MEDSALPNAEHIPAVDTQEWSPAERRVLRSKGLLPEHCRKTDELDLSHYLAFTINEPVTPAIVQEALATAQSAINRGMPELSIDPNASFTAGMSFAQSLSPIFPRGGAGQSGTGSGSIDLNASLDLSGVDTTEKAVAQKVARYVNDTSVSRANAQARKDPAAKSFEQTVKEQPLSVSITGHVSVQDPVYTGAADKPFVWPMMKLDVYFPAGVGHDVLGFTLPSGFAATGGILPYMLPSSAETSIKGVAASNTDAATPYSLFSSTYKAMIARFDEKGRTWYRRFSKLSTTSAVATMSAFDENFIQSLRDDDAYHYTFAPLAGIARMVRDATEESILETEDVLRTWSKLCPDTIRFNTAFKQELLRYTREHVGAKHMFTASARHVTVLDKKAKAAILAVLNSDMLADVKAEFHQRPYTYHELLAFLHNTRRDFIDDWAAQSEIDEKLNMAMPPHFGTPKQWANQLDEWRRFRVQLWGHDIDSLNDVLWTRRILKSLMSQPWHAKLRKFVENHDDACKLDPNLPALTSTAVWAKVEQLHNRRVRDNAVAQSAARAGADQRISALSRGFSREGSPSDYGRVPVSDVDVAAFTRGFTAHSRRSPEHSGLSRNQAYQNQHARHRHGSLEPGERFVDHGRRDGGKDRSQSPHLSSTGVRFTSRDLRPYERGHQPRYGDERARAEAFRGAHAAPAQCSACPAGLQIGLSPGVGAMILHRLGHERTLGARVPNRLLVLGLVAFAMKTLVVGCVMFV